MLGKISLLSLKITQKWMKKVWPLFNEVYFMLTVFHKWGRNMGEQNIIIWEKMLAIPKSICHLIFFKLLNTSTKLLHSPPKSFIKYSSITTLWVCTFLNKIPKDSVETALIEASFFNSYWNRNEKFQNFTFTKWLSRISLQLSKLKNANCIDLILYEYLITFLWKYFTIS